MDSPLMRALTVLANVILLSGLWLIFSIPIITIGPATAALYYVTQKMVQGRNQHFPLLLQELSGQSEAGPPFDSQGASKN